MILGYSTKSYDSQKSFNLINGILENDKITTYVYNHVQPLSTIKKIVIVIPPNAEKESGFFYWLSNLWRLAKNCGGGVKFFAAPHLEALVRAFNEASPINYSFEIFTEWEDLLVLSREFTSDDLVTFILSRKNNVSYNSHMGRVFTYLDRYFRQQNFLLIYPAQAKTSASDDFYNHHGNTAMDATVDIRSLSKNISKIFNKN